MSRFDPGIKRAVAVFPDAHRLDFTQDDHIPLIVRHRVPGVESVTMERFIGLGTEEPRLRLAVVTVSGKRLEVVSRHPTDSPELRFNFAQAAIFTLFNWVTGRAE